MAGMLASDFGLLMALATPLQLLLTLHLLQIAQNSAQASLGVITGFGALIGLVANPIGGRISDRTAARFGRRRTWILTGGLVGAAVLFAVVFTTEVWQVALVWCIVCAAFNFQLAATSALMPDQIRPERRGTASGLIGLAAAAGPLFGLFVVSMLQDPVAQWAVVAVIAAVLAVFAVLVIRDPQHSRREGEGGLGVVELLKSFWLNPWKHPAFGWAWTVRFLIMCGYSAGGYTAFYLIDRFEVPTELLSQQVLLLAVISVATLAISSVGGGFLSDKLRRQKPFVVAAGVLGAGGLVMMAFAPSLAFVYLATAAIGLGTGLFLAVDSALCVRMLPSTENAGKDFAIINIANTLPQSLVPFVAPLLIAAGGYIGLYITIACVALLGAVAVLRLPEIGREGDRHWAVITRGGPVLTTTTVV
jgi:MFS family permease